MFKDFANIWTIIGVSRDLRATKPLAVKVAGEQLVLFRDMKGAPAAVSDRCPHRGVALSMGKVKDGCIECPFHGWKFNREGSNCKVPWNPESKKQTLGILSFPVRELGGLLWLYTAPGTAPHEPMLPEVLHQKDVVVAALSLHWKTHWTRAMENMLDWPHLPFIHAKTIGRGMKMTSESRMDIHMEERDYGLQSTISIDGALQPGGLDYRFPNAMQLFIPVPSRTLQMIAVCLPIDEKNTRMILISLRNFLRPRLFNSIFRKMNRKVASEDQAVLESSFPIEVPEPSEEKSVRTDALTLKFRRLWRERLKGSQASLPLYKHGAKVFEIKSKFSDLNEYLEKNRQ
jgi:phenylpropionate dioxygenase-like ring-hydroxylating dioxygenase large terminal subunit